MLVMEEDSCQHVVSVVSWCKDGLIGRWVSCLTVMRTQQFISVNQCFEHDDQRYGSCALGYFHEYICVCVNVCMYVIQLCTISWFMPVYWLCIYYVFTDYVSFRQNRLCIIMYIQGLHTTICYHVPCFHSYVQLHVLMFITVCQHADLVLNKTMLKPGTFVGQSCSPSRRKFPHWWQIHKAMASNFLSLLPKSI